MLKASNVPCALLALGIGVSGCADDEPTCAMDDVTTRAELRQGGVRCDICDLAGNTPQLFVILETTCEPGVNWTSPGARLVDIVRWSNNTTGASDEYLSQIDSPGEVEWSVAPGVPQESLGPPLDLVLGDPLVPGDYSFELLLEFDLPSASFDVVLE